MDIFKIERYLNSLDDTIVERRHNIFTNEIKFFGVLELFDGIVHSEIGSIELQSKDVHSAVNEWRLKNSEVLAKLAPKIVSIRKKQKSKENKKQSWYKKLFFVK